jgi:acyl-CoA synthetase (AMP-forming)/AMP-acid ligase II
MDEDGFVFIVDRLRDMIITGGFNVWPSEVEQTVHAIPGVKDCAVIGVPDDRWGEAVTAVVELRDGAQVHAADVIAACRAALGPVKTPKAVVFRELPRSPVGKVLKRTLRDEYWTGADRAV